MTLRLPEEDSAALARTAELERRSQHEVVLRAVREYIERSSRTALIDQVMDAELPRYAEALERLGR
jgi:predicted transcriptional regulator